MFEDEISCEWENIEMDHGTSRCKLTCKGPPFGDGISLICHRFNDPTDTLGVVPERWQRYLLGQAKGLYDKYYQTHPRMDTPELLAYDLVDQED